MKALTVMLKFVFINFSHFCIMSIFFYPEGNLQNNWNLCLVFSNNLFLLFSQAWKLNVLFRNRFTPSSVNLNCLTFYIYKYKLSNIILMALAYGFSTEFFMDNMQFNFRCFWQFFLFKSSITYFCFPKSQMFLISNTHIQPK